MAKRILPQPLFDTLEQLSEENAVCRTAPRFAKQDFKLALDFLMQYDGSKATFKCYRREVERLLQWAWLIQEKSVLDLKRKDIEAYVKFCMKPPLSWISLKKAPRFKASEGKRIANPEWRPFIMTVSKTDAKNGEPMDKKSYAMSQKTIQEIFVAIGSFYNYLLIENITEINPVTAIRQKSKFIRKNQSAHQVQRLSETQWKAVIAAAKAMAHKNPDKHERTLFIITALYLMYLRISELVASERWSPQMSHFHKDSHGNWWFTTVGKGNKSRDITVSDGMLDALKRWREHLGLSPTLPMPNDNTPLIPKQKGQGNISDTSIIHRIVQTCFDAAIDSLTKKGKKEEAQSMTSASAHWLRHTGISDDINKRNRPMAHVRDDAGHASIATTDRYNDITLKERHASGKKKLTDL